jgi:WD40 repeat protein
VQPFATELGNAVFQKGHANAISCLAFSPKNPLLLASGDMSEGLGSSLTMLLPLIMSPASMQDVSSCSHLVSHMKLNCLAGSSDFTIRLWNASTLRQLAVLQGHQASITSLAFNR